MAHPTTKSERVTAFREPNQQLQIQRSTGFSGLWKATTTWWLPPAPSRFLPTYQRDSDEEFQVPSLIASIRPDATPLLSSPLRRLLAAACLLALPAALSAQTAAFGCAQSTVGTGLSNGYGVAADREVS